jgi:hypothetical protein
MSTEISINLYLSDSGDNLDPDIARKIDKNDFVQKAITSYDREDMKNDTL